MVKRLALWCAFLAAGALCQDKPIHLVAGFRPAPEPPELGAAGFLSPGHHERLRFGQLPEGIWITGLPPAVIALPASELAPIPSPAKYTRFGREVPAADDKDWLNRADQRRALLRQLVSPRFELRGRTYVETRSTQAAKALGPGDESLIPRSVPERVGYEDRPGNGVLIPWNALPPRSDLLLETVAIQIVTASSEAFSYVIHLGRPRQFYYSPCHLPLTTIVHGDLRPGFFLPQPSDLLDTIYGWEDPTVWIPEPALMLHSQKAHLTQLGEDEWLCGPLLKYRRGAAETAVGELWREHQFDPALDTPAQAGVSTDAAGFEAVRLPGNRGFLAISRPRRHSYGGGWGRCTDQAVSWSVFHFDSLPPTPGVTYGHFKFVQGRVGLRIDCDQPNEPKDYEVQFSPDLQTIIEFEGYGDSWGESIDHKSLVWRTRTLTWKNGAFVQSAWHPSVQPLASALRRKELRW